MLRLATVVLAAMLILTITGCAPSAPIPEATLTSEPTEARTEVDWDQYPPDAQRLIDEAEGAGDCTALQDTFDVADTAGHLDQMNYIDEALELAGCY